MTQAGSVLYRQPGKIKSMNDDGARLRQLEAKLELLTENFNQEMRTRGFDPEQIDNVALPSSLANLYLDCLSVADEIEKIKGKD